MSILIPEAPMGRSWADIHMVKGVFVRFGFDRVIGHRVSVLPIFLRLRAKRGFSAGH